VLARASALSREMAVRQAAGSGTQNGRCGNCDGEPDASLLGGGGLVILF